LLEVVHQLEMQSLDADPKTSGEAFQALMRLHDRQSGWLYLMTIFHPASLAVLLHRLPEKDASARYQRGEHVGAWAGIELARRYKQMKAELGSRSNRSVSRFQSLRLGFKIANLEVPPNRWFRREFERRTDYRPTTEMSIWVARKIEAVRRLKENRSQWRQFAAMSVVAGELRFANDSETEAVLSEAFSSDVVPGDEGLRRLDSLPPFGRPDVDGYDAWRKFINHRLQTNGPLLKEFDRLFAGRRRKLDGVIAATLRSAWRAVQRGGNIILP
jgi:hypothetical protein